MSAVAVLGFAGCATYDGQPSPTLSFENYAPVMLNVQGMNIQEDYLVKSDPKDVAGQFVIPPNEAIRQYISRRFQSSGTGSGQFNVVIEDARVHFNELKEDNRVLNWSGIGQEDEYEIFVRIKVTPMPDGARASASTYIKMNRTLVMPSSVTVTEREMRQIQFMEKLIADIDASVMKTIGDVPGILQ